MIYGSKNGNDGNHHRYKKIIFAMIEAGGGHKSPAVAMKQAIEELYGAKYELRIMDFMKDTGCIDLDKKHKRTWEFYLSHPFLCKISYLIANLVGPVFRAGLKLIYLPEFYDYVYRFIEQYKPNVIVSTHPFNTIAIDYVRRKYNLNVTLINFLTEIFSMTSFWVLKDVDYYIVSSQRAKNKLIRRGISKDILYVFNYPIRREFFEIAKTERQIADELGLSISKKTILISFGGQGEGYPYRFIDALIREKIAANIIVITGKNKEIYEDLKIKYYKMDNGNLRLIILGYITNMNEIMSVSDMCFIKPGPSTMMEAIALKKPIILYKSVQISETANIHFVLNREIGFYVGKSVKKFINTIKKLMDNDCIKRIEQNYDKLNVKNGAYDIAKFIADIAENKGYK